MVEPLRWPNMPPDLTIGEIIARANSRPGGIWCASWSYREWMCDRCGLPTAAVFGSADEEECGHCGASPPEPRVLGHVSAVDVKNKTITVSGAAPDHAYRVVAGVACCERSRAAHTRFVVDVDLRHGAPYP